MVVAFQEIQRGVDITLDSETTFGAGKGSICRRNPFFDDKVIVRTGSGCTSLVEFLDHLAKEFRLVGKVSNEFLQRVIVLNLPVDAFVNKFEAGIGQGLSLIPIADIEFGDIRMVFQNLIGQGMEILFGLGIDLPVQLLDFGIVPAVEIGTLLLHVPLGLEGVDQLVLLHHQHPERIDIVLPEGEVACDPGQGCFTPGVEPEFFGAG